jgi:hypothetical protein
MSIHELLLIRREERTALLERAQQMLERDGRIRAAWLFGSLGRGDDDDLSDIDLFTVTGDEHLDGIAADRHAYVSGLARPLLLLEAPQNRPPGGAYLMAIYDGQAGPHQVDWYWQRESIACIPQQTVLIFDRAGLPHAGSPTRFEFQPVPERSPLEAANQAVDSFWVGLLIAAKNVARTDGTEDPGWQEWVRSSLEKVQQFLGMEPAAPAGGESHLTDPFQKLAILHDLADEMEPLMSRVPPLRGKRSIEIAARARVYLQTIQAIVEQDCRDPGAISLRRNGG